MEIDHTAYIPVNAKEFLSLLKGTTVRKNGKSLNFKSRDDSVKIEKILLENDLSINSNTVFNLSIVIKDCVFTKEFNIQNATFRKSLSIQDSSFNSETNFDQSKLESLSFINCDIFSLLISSIAIENFEIKNTELKGNFLIDNSSFSQLTLLGSLFESGLTIEQNKISKFETNNCEYHSLLIEGMSSDLFQVRGGKFQNFKINGGLFQNLSITGGQYEIFVINGGHFEKRMFINDGNFYDGFLIDGGHFENGITVRGGSFSNQFSVGNGEFDATLSFERGSFQKVKILNGDFKSGITFTSGNYKEEVDISNGQFNELLKIVGGEYENSFTISGGEYYKGVSVNGGNFHGSFIVKNGIFRDDFIIRQGHFPDLKLLNGEFKKLIVESKFCQINNFLVSSTINHECWIKSLRIQNWHFECLILGDGRVFTEEVEVQSLTFCKTLNEGRMSFSSPIIKGSSYLKIFNSDLGNTSFFNTDFLAFDKIEVSDSRLSDIITTNNHFPISKEKKVYTCGEPLNSQFLEEMYNQLFLAMKKQGNRTQEVKYYSEYLEWHRINKLKKAKVRGDWYTPLSLWLHKMSSSYGRNWARSFIFILIFGWVFYFAFAVSHPSIDLGFEHLTLSNFKFHFRYYSEFLLPTHKFTYFPDNPGGWSPLWDVLGRIFIGFFIYQTVAAFRRFGKL